MTTNHRKVLFCPPIKRSAIERGTLALIARYVSEATQTSFLRCNGMFLSCDRDVEYSFHRAFNTCLNCMKESHQFGEWSGASQFDLGAYLPASDIERTKRWIAEVPEKELKEATFDGSTPFDWIKKLFLARFDNATFDGLNRQHELFARRYMLTVIRARLAARRLLFAIRPDFLCAVPRCDIPSSACIEAARDMGVRVVEIAWQPQKRVMVIEDWQQSRTFESDLVIQEFANIKNDPTQWPSEVSLRLSQIAQFLGIQVQTPVYDSRKVVHGQ